MRKILLGFAFFLIIVGAIFSTQNFLSKEGKLSFLKKTPVVTINDHVFKVAVAKSLKEREIGLSETKFLSENQGMIFLFEEPNYYSFWMKNMKFPIDIIYLNKDIIVTIKNNVQPLKNDEKSPIIYVPIEPSDRVLEIQAGLSEKYNFKKGDKVKYENLGN